MKTFLTLILFVFFITSCSNDDHPIEYPTTFTSTKFSGEKIRVFTKKGEVTDSEITLKLIERIKTELSNLNSVDLKNELSVTYLSSTNVELNTKNSSPNKILNLYETKEITYWESRDTSFAMVSNTPNRFNFKENHLEYRPLFEEHFKLLSPLTGYNDAVKIKECNYVKNKGQFLLMPFLDYYFTKYTEFNGNTFIRQESAGKINNAFNSESFSKLGVNDTLVIQEYNLELHIKN